MIRRLISIFVVLVVLGGGGFFLKQKLAAAESASEQIQYKLAAVETGKVKKTVSASGILQAWKVVDIKARAGGELTFLGVDVGSEVKAGQLLARIDPLDTQLQVNQARADERSAIARRDQSSKTWQLQVKQSQIAISDAEASLRSAQANLAAAQARLITARQQSETQPELTRTAIANAQASYEQARQQRAQLNETNQQQRAAAAAAYKQAIANRDNARLQLDRQKALVEKGFVAQQAVDSAQAALEVAEATVMTTKIKLDTVDAELRATADSADSRIAQTKAALEQATAGKADILNRQTSVRESEAAVKQSEAAVSRARIALIQARTNTANNAIRRFDIDTSTATIVRASATRVNAETTLKRTEIRAPMDGVVLSKTVEQGTIIASALGISSAGASMMQMGDTSRMYIDVAVDETDVANVDLDQKVDISIEAYPGIPFDGKVIRVDPQTTVAQNVTSVHVRVEIDNSSPTFKLLKPGMNSSCAFVVGEKDNVIKVPNDALKDDSDGSKFVEVATGGKPAPADPKTGTPAEEGMLVDVKKTKVKVEIGLEGNDETEIVSGVKEGDKIITQTVEPEPPKAAGGSSPFGGGGRGMGGGTGRGR